MTAATTTTCTTTATGMTTRSDRFDQELMEALAENERMGDRLSELLLGLREAASALESGDRAGAREIIRELLKDK